jgi:hypothetical protein
MSSTFKAAFTVTKFALDSGLYLTLLPWVMPHTDKTKITCKGTKKCLFQFSLIVEGATEIRYAECLGAFQLVRILSFLHIVGLESLHWLIGPFVVESSRNSYRDLKKWKIKI